MPLASIARHLPARILVAAALLGFGLAAACRPALAQLNDPVAPDAQLDNSAADFLADPECLTIAQSSPSTYTISNSACPDQSILASIELGGPGSTARCFTKKIRTQISIASEAAAPVINYQCIEGVQGCSVDIVRGMFPECHAS